MTDRSSKAKAAAKQKPAGDYPVGYARPPAQHQFKKGASGNPGGRKPRAKEGRLFEEQAKRLAMQELYRLVTVREGDKTERIPAIQAVFRMMVALGLKGKTQVLRDLLAFIRVIEGDRRDETLELMMDAVNYKENAAKIREQCKKENVAVPELVPDPDDIHSTSRLGPSRLRVR